MSELAIQKRMLIDSVSAVEKLGEAEGIPQRIAQEIGELTGKDVGPVVVQVRSRECRRCPGFHARVVRTRCARSVPL